MGSSQLVYLRGILTSYFPNARADGQFLFLPFGPGREPTRFGIKKMFALLRLLHQSLDQTYSLSRNSEVLGLKSLPSSLPNFRPHKSFHMHKIVVFRLMLSDDRNSAAERWTI